MKRWNLVINIVKCHHHSQRRHGVDEADDLFSQKNYIRCFFLSYYSKRHSRNMSSVSNRKTQFYLYIKKNHDSVFHLIETASLPIIEKIMNMYLSFSNGKRYLKESYNLRVLFVFSFLFNYFFFLSKRKFNGAHSPNFHLSSFICPYL